MEAVEPSKQARFCNRFRAVAHNIAKGISDSQAATYDGNWTTWAEFFLDVSPDPLLVLYRYPLTILDTFVRQYRTGPLAASRRKVRLCTFDNYICSIGQALATMRAPVLCLTS